MHRQIRHWSSATGDSDWAGGTSWISAERAHQLVDGELCNRPCLMFDCSGTSPAAMQPSCGSVPTAHQLAGSLCPPRTTHLHPSNASAKPGPPPVEWGLLTYLLHSLRLARSTTPSPGCLRISEGRFITKRSGTDWLNTSVTAVGTAVPAQEEAGTQGGSGSISHGVPAIISGHQTP